MNTRSQSAPVSIGAYYFDGWSGINPLADNPDEPWAKNAPTHLTRNLAGAYGEREPVWGWRNDDPAIMEQQLDIAADHGIDFFAFCWYWHEDDKTYSPEGIASDPKHTSLGLYIQAPNKQRLKFCLLIANHDPLSIKGLDAWKIAIDDHDITQDIGHGSEMDVRLEGYDIAIDSFVDHNIVEDSCPRRRGPGHQARRDGNHKGDGSD